jgi:hypothetical protein
MEKKGENDTSVDIFRVGVANAEIAEKFGGQEETLKEVKKMNKDAGGGGRSAG